MWCDGGVRLKDVEGECESGDSGKGDCGAGGEVPEDGAGGRELGCLLLVGSEFSGGGHGGFVGMTVGMVCGGMVGGGMVGGRECG